MNRRHSLPLVLSLVLTALFLTAPLSAQAPTPVFVAVTWSDAAVHFLDGNLDNISSFPAGASNPNGIATDGVLIFTGHFTSQEVIAHDFSGVEQFRWPASISNLQGMELVGNELAIANAGYIQFHDPFTGALVRTIPDNVGSVEGIAYDGTYLWLLGNEINAVDPTNGNIVTTIANAATGCSFGGTGITASAQGEFHLACTDGNWYRVSATNGSVLDSGNNGLDMYGLKLASGTPLERMQQPPVPALGTAGLVLLFGLLASMAWIGLRRRSA